MVDLFNTERSPRGAAAEDVTRACLTDDEVLEFVGGQVSGPRAMAIHAHVDRCSGCQQLVTSALQRSSSGLTGGAGAADSSWGTTFRRGDLVASRYRIQRFIARGGMGEVYEAFDDDLEERVALKTVLATSSDSERAVRRLKAEVQLAHRVSHQNVCRIYDLGAHVLTGTRTVMNFLTMEFVEGERLRERIERGRILPRDAVSMAREMLNGLRAAHAAGILHRDFKSDNVMLRPQADGRAAAVIMDFGLARAIDVQNERHTSGTNGLVGTPCYMAPEQLEGGALTVASDVYSFGIVFFEMLTGQLPFSQKAPFERLHRAPRRRPSSFHQDIPEGIDKVVLRCLEREREKRFESAEAVLSALDALDDASRLAVRSGLPARRSSRLLLAGTVLAFVLAAVFALRSPSPRSVGAPAALAANRVVGAPPQRTAEPAPTGVAAFPPSLSPALAPPKSADVPVPRAEPKSAPVHSAPRPSSSAVVASASTEAASAAEASSVTATVVEPSAVEAAAPRVVEAPAPSTAPVQRAAATPIEHEASPPVRSLSRAEKNGFLDPFSK